MYAEEHKKKRFVVVVNNWALEARKKRMRQNEGKEVGKGANTTFLHFSPFIGVLRPPHWRPSFPISLLLITISRSPCKITQHPLLITICQTLANPSFPIHGASSNPAAQKLKRFPINQRSALALLRSRPTRFHHKSTYCQYHNRWKFMYLCMDIEKTQRIVEHRIELHPSF